MFEVCSYCQRRYGTRSSSGYTLFKTLDHFVPISKLGICRGDKLTYVQIDNLVDSCQECNTLKANLSPEQFKKD
jgi:hypothetical protein